MHVDAAVKVKVRRAALELQTCDLSCFSLPACETCMYMSNRRDVRMYVPASYSSK